MLKYDNWFITFKKNYNASMRLFCFHYAGSSASIFRTWAQDMPDWAELTAIQLPGRENRYSEQLLYDVFAVVDRLHLAFDPYINKPFVIFGHSMGSLIAFEFIRKLRRERMIQPKHLIISGTKAPHTLAEKPLIYNLPDTEFIQELKKYNGIPQELIENEELINIFLPVIRADFCISQAYKYNNEKPLNCPITVFGGINDNTFDKQNLFKWKEQTLGAFNSNLFSGDHFFIKSSYTEVIAIINQILKDTMY